MHVMHLRQSYRPLIGSIVFYTSLNFTKYTVSSMNLLHYTLGNVLKTQAI